MEEQDDVTGELPAEAGAKAVGIGVVTGWDGKERRQKLPFFPRNRRWYETMGLGALDARIRRIIKEGNR